MMLDKLIVELIQESRDFIGHLFKVMTPDKKGLGIIFDIFVKFHNIIV
jgi:hypothetical protein